MNGAASHLQTTKERNMWSCEYEKGSPVLLLFRVPASSVGSGISKMRIWNFNKTLKVSLSTFILKHCQFLTNCGWLHDIHVYILYINKL